MSKNTKNEWVVKGVKTFEGHEGRGYNCNLYRNGKKVAFVFDDASGGEVMIDWVDHQKERVEFEFITFGGEKKTRKGTPEEKMLNEYLATLPSRDDHGFGDYYITDGIFIEELVNDYEEKKWLKRQCYTKTLFTTPDCKKNEFRTVKAKFCEEVKKFILGKYPEAVILNETL